MNDTSQCPRCQTPMLSIDNASDTNGAEADVTASSLSCEKCRGVFVPPIQIHNELLDAAQPVETNSDEDTRLVCPGCQQRMTELMLGDVAIDRCGACGGVWLDGQLVGSMWTTTMEREVSRTTGEVVSPMSETSLSLAAVLPLHVLFS